MCIFIIKTIRVTIGVIQLVAVEFSELLLIIMDTFDAVSVITIGINLLAVYPIGIATITIANAIIDTIGWNTSTIAGKFDTVLLYVILIDKVMIHTIGSDQAW